MLKIYGNKKSGPCNKVQYIAKLVGIEYEFKEMDFQKDLKTEEYLKIHPAGKIPAIDDDGFILFESGAICEYLCEKKENSLLPKDLKKRALVKQWMDFSNLHIGTAVGKVFFNRVVAERMKMSVNEQSLKEGLTFLDRFLPIIDNQLSKNKYLALDEISLADITLLSNLGYAEMADIDLTKYKAISKWMKNLKDMDFYKKVHEK